MAKVLKTTFKLRRGLSTEWAQANPVLANGEPAFEYDTFRLKIGNGVDTYNSLPYVGSTSGENGVFNAQTRFDFPSLGSVDIIYKAQQEKKIYQWNPSISAYEVIGSEDSSIDIELINGGDAYGTNS